jgi:hypothetical protein
MQVNDILYSTWGYEQTNVDFYKVVKVQNGWATLQSLKSRHEDTPQWMTYRATPGEPTNAKPFRRKIKNYGSGDWVGLTTYSHASEWDGQPISGSSYA